MVKMWEEIMQQPKILERCGVTNERIIHEIVEVLKISNIHSIVIAARGTSDHAGIYAKYVIECCLGIPVSLAAPSVVTVYGKRMSFKNCLVIGISQSGKAADVLEVLREANRSGGVTVSITNYLDSPLALESRFHLYTDAGIEESVAATKTFTSQMYLIARLTAVWSNDSSMESELDRVPTKVLSTIQTLGDIKEKVQRYRYMNECFVLSRGINYPIALEAALKIQETTYVRAKGYATSDFYHGPFAMIEKDTPVILYAPEGPCLKYASEMVKKLKEIKAELIIVSNNSSIVEAANTSFDIPETDNDIISPFFNIVVGQIFACQLAIAKGLNPDMPRGLNKVTITK